LIFVTVGNANQGFGRLLQEVDRLAGQGLFKNEEVFLQTGHHPGFTPQYSQAQAFLGPDEFMQKMKDSSLLIAHGGCTVLQALSLGKLPVVMPRMQRYDEHINDHQVFFVRALAQKERIVPAFEPPELEKAILLARQKGGRQSTPLPPSSIHAMIRQAIEKETF
jgi:UDP-N-acetylglucosamine transferase subunit ALG13